MNADTFAEWLRRQGHQVYRTVSSYWYDAGPRVLQAFPYHWLITPEKKEIRDLMMGHGIIALRYSTPLDFPEGRVSYHVVLHAPYELEALKSQARNGVKRGLEHFQLEQISFERLATEGWALQYDTLVRQDRLRSMKQGEWERLCRSADGLPGFEAWAATCNGELAGAVIICRIDDVFTVPYAMSRSSYLSSHVNNALFYSVSCEMLKREGITGVFYTVQSLDASANVDEFKFRMGFEPRAIRQRVVFHPIIGPFATSTVHAWIRRLFQREPSNPFLAKAEGMFHFHVEGKYPLAQQTWPECLSCQKESLLDKMRQIPHGGIMSNFDGCQLPNVPKFSIGPAEPMEKSLIGRIKRLLAFPWNRYVKKWLKQAYYISIRRGGSSAQMATEDFAPAVSFKTGDLVRVRARAEISATLNPFKESKGCAFLTEMQQYCGTTQRVLQVMERFLDERDYKVKKARGIVLLEGVICRGTPAFGRCDRCCHFFWREEWLERIAEG